MEMLSALRAAGVRTALVSNKADFAVKALAKTYFADLLDVALGEIPTLPRKPAPDMIYHVLDVLGVSPSQALFVGDSDVDVLTAKNAGVAGIFVTWGFRDKACLAQAGATRFADTPALLLAEILP
jgi:phosphoglycolate phosphatase